MQELEVIEEINVENMIYEIRGVQVMLASDVALQYNVETKRINETIKRNINRFPNTFCFQITREELELISSRSQNATLNKSNNLRGYNIKYLPYVLTEQGIIMLSGLLKSDIAAKVNVKIVDAFVKMRKYISKELNSINVINSKLLEHDNRIMLIENTLNKLSEKQKNNSIFFKGQIFDAYVVMMEICESAKEEIIIIDDYAGKELLKLLKNINKKIILISSNINENDIKKYQKQYNNVQIKKSDSFHDRFIIIDRKILYHCGASFKDLGNKCFAINLIEDKKIICDIIKEIEE